jgi:hypothetical protein
MSAFAAAAPTNRSVGAWRPKVIRRLNVHGASIHNS